MNKNNRVKAGLSFGVGIAVFFILRYFLINDKQTTSEIIKSVVAGLATGAISGVLVVWLLVIFAKYK